MKTQPTHTIDCDNRNEGFCICGAEPKRMLPTYTPTPWTLAYNDALQIHANDNGETYRFIARMDSELDTGKTDYERTQEDIANAAFIVRAVNAHEALVAFVKDIASEKCYEEPGEFPEFGEDGQIPCRSCQAREVMQAIAKAEGR